METFQSAISVKGLGDDIFTALTLNAQEKAKEKILTAARNGQTRCSVKQKGITPVFIDQLEQEGFCCIPNDDEDRVLIYWEW